MTTFKGVKDLALTTIATPGALNNTTDPITFDVAAGTGAEFPAAGSFWITVWNKSTFPDPNDDSTREVMLVTSRTTDSLTATRGQLGTSNQVHTGTPTVAMLWHAQHVDDITGAIATLEATGVLNGPVTFSDTTTSITTGTPFDLVVAVGTGGRAWDVFLTKTINTSGPGCRIVCTTTASETRSHYDGAAASVHATGTGVNLSVANSFGTNITLTGAVYNSGTGNLTLTFTCSSGTNTLSVYGLANSL